MAHYTAEEIRTKLAALGSDSIDDRARAVAELRDCGMDALPDLVDLLGSPDASIAARVWAMIAIGQLGPSATSAAHASLVRSLADESPTVRRAAIRAMGQLRDVAASREIAKLISDHTLDPSAWFDDDCTVSQAAEETLRALGDHFDTDSDRRPTQR